MFIKTLEFSTDRTNNFLILQVSQIVLVPAWLVKLLTGREFILVWVLPLIARPYDFVITWSSNWPITFVMNGSVFGCIWVHSSKATLSINFFYYLTFNEYQRRFRLFILCDLWRLQKRSRTNLIKGIYVSYSLVFTLDEQFTRLRNMLFRFWMTQDINIDRIINRLCFHVQFY